MMKLFLRYNFQNRKLTKQAKKTKTAIDSIIETDRNFIIQIALCQKIIENKFHRKIDLTI